MGMENIFGLRLAKDGGQMYLGGNASHLIDTVSASQGVGWTPRVAGSAFYAMEVVDVKVAGRSLGLPPVVFNKGDAIVDSGTSDVCFPATAFTAVKGAFSSLCYNSSTCLKGICDCHHHKPLTEPIFENRCVEMTAEEKAAFPVIEVAFGGGLVVPWKPEQYLRSGDTFNCDSPTAYTISISRGGKDGSGTIFGDTFMRGYTVIHDKRPPQRIGFAPL